MAKEYKSLRVTKDLHTAIKKIAKKEGRTIISHLEVTYGVKRK